MTRQSDSTASSSFTGPTCRSGRDRRERGDRRRSAQGLFELRARREGIDGDRRQQRRNKARTPGWLAFWRRKD